MLSKASCTSSQRSLMLCGVGCKLRSSHPTWLLPIFKRHLALTAGTLMCREGSRCEESRTGGQSWPGRRGADITHTAQSRQTVCTVVRRPHFHPVYSQRVSGSSSCSPYNQKLVNGPPGCQFQASQTNSLCEVQAKFQSFGQKQHCI